MFSRFRQGRQTGTACYAVGPRADGPEPVGDVLTADTPVGFDSAAKPDGLKPHDGMLTEFPYLGLPNVYPA